MKKFLIVCIGIVVIIYSTLRLFGNYNSNSVLYNQASFEMYMDTNSFNIDTYFSLEKGTFDNEKHIVVCKFPVEIGGFKLAYSLLNTDLSNVDCNEKYQKEKHNIFEPYELKGSNFELVIVNKFTNLITLNTPIGESKIIAKKVEYCPYKKGEVNRIVLSKNGLTRYCQQNHQNFLTH